MTKYFLVVRLESFLELSIATYKIKCKKEKKTPGGNNSAEVKSQLSGGKTEYTKRNGALLEYP